MKNPRKGRGARIVGALASIKLSIFLFFALAGTSIFGTIIQQKADPRAYIESYGPLWAKLFNALNLVDMYHSWWFQLLLALLLVNSVVCSARRLPAALRSIRRRQFPAAEELRRKSLKAAWEVGDGAEQSVEEVLKEKFGKPRSDRSEGAVTWFAQKQPWARLGAYVAHVSLVLFFLGGIVGARWGFKGFVNIPEGGAVSSVPLRSGGSLQLPFEVRCESFELENYPDGRPKDYLSRLSVRKDGRVVQEKTIEVNHPLIQDGIYFYQSSYRIQGGGALLQILDRDGSRRGGSVRVAEGGAARVPGTDLGIRVLQTSENYQGFGPAAEVVLFKANPSRDRVGQPFALFQNHPQFDARRGGEFVVQLSGLLPGRASTGLQVAKDPGVPLIWAGSILVTLGTMMAFFAAHRRVWVRLENDQLTLAGAASRNLGAFREVFDRLEDELRGRTAPAEKRLRAAG